MPIRIRRSELIESQDPVAVDRRSGRSVIDEHELMSGICLQLLTGKGQDSAPAPSGAIDSE